MKITTAWLARHDDPSPADLLSAYDESQRDEWNGVPDWHTKEIADHADDGEIRELVIEIPDEAVAGLFQAPIVRGTTSTR